MIKLADVRSKAKQLGIMEPASNRTDLIRQIQTYEGYSPCFKTKNKCDEMKCSWRNECLKK
ncbi:MAG: hypothetical protein JW768_09100 [Chitinispirillaceae bacterium]|nr:hypothetical protein [Chitinispirillaceae bacterium]